MRLKLRGHAKKTKRIWHPQTAETSKFVSLVLPANVTKRHKTKTPQPSLQSSQRDAINDDVSHQTFFSKIAMTKVVALHSNQHKVQAPVRALFQLESL